MTGAMRCRVGGYIPIPDGFERDECIFFASVQAAGGGDVHGAQINREGMITDAKWHTDSINYLVIASHSIKDHQMPTT